MMMTEEERNKLRIEDDYLNWLIDIVGDEFEGKTYEILLRLLYETEFYYYVNNDVNRADDGIALRKEFVSVSYKGKSERESVLNDILSGPCRCLEMLVAFARKIDTGVMFDPDAGDRTNQWFWMMICNLGLDKYDDDCRIVGYTYKVHDALIAMMDRRYSPDGRGGLFPLKKSHEDQRNIELWYQMAAYMNEKYPV